MPRLPRIQLANVPLHIVQRGNNRNACFFCEADYLVYLQLLTKGSETARCDIHAYALMTNHIHLLLTPSTENAASRLMKAVGEQYVHYINRRHGRAGTLWQGRFRSCLVHDDSYFLACHRYIEMNPVRAGMVESPDQYRWSSHAHNALGAAQGLVTPHAIYKGLGADQASRCRAYRALFETDRMPGAVDALRAATNRNFYVGQPPSACTTSNAASATPQHLRPGRPRLRQLNDPSAP